MPELPTRPPAFIIAAATAPPTIPGLPPTSTEQTGPPGRSRVFAGDWLANGCDCHLYTDGYVGDLMRRYNGWAVFRTTRAVAEAIVAHHQNTFTQAMAGHAGVGMHLAGAWLATLTQLTSITWLASLIIVDSRRSTADNTHVEVTTPDADGCYTIGWGWAWDDVEAADVHTIHGGGR
jgi:hypothetical protein